MPCEQGGVPIYMWAMNLCFIEMINGMIIGIWAQGH